MVASNRLVERFNRTRGTLQRLNDCRMLHGWAQDVRPQRVLFKTELATLVKPGEEFHCEFLGKGELVRFRALASSIENDVLSLLIQGEPQFAPSTQEARVIFGRLPVEVEWNEGTQEATLLDLSLGGAALLLPTPVVPGTLIRIRFDPGNGLVICDCEVRYSRTHETETRIGVRFTKIDRLDRSRLSQLFEDRS